MTVRPLLLGVGWDRPGGLNRYLRDLRDALSAAQVETRTLVLAPASEVPDEVDVVAHEDAPLLRRLREYARAAGRAAPRADVVDAHFALFAWWPVRVGSLRRHPLVVHFHGPWAGESAVGADRLGMSGRAKLLLERSVYGRADRLIVLSQAFADLLVRDYAIAPWRVRVLRPGVDLQRFTPDRQAARERLGLQPQERLIFSARRLVARMGLEVLLEACTGLARPGERLLLAIAGDGPLRDELEAHARRLGLQDSVRLLGHVSEDDLVDHYRAADLCVLPTLALEGFGLVVVEALACGTPVVVTDVGGLPEVVRDLDASLVVPSGDAQALRDRIRSALDGAVPDALACRAHAETFDWASAAGQNLAVYEEAVAERSGLRPDGRLRVAYLDHCAQLSGAEIALVRLLEALPDVDAQVLLAESGPLQPRLTAAGAHVVVRPLDEGVRDLSRDRVQPARVPGRALVALVCHVLALAGELRRVKPDLIHTNSLKAALYGGVAGRLAGVPVVWHARDRIAEDYLPRPAVRLVRAAVAWLPDAVIANSQATADTLRLRRRPVDVIGDPYAPTRTPAVKRAGSDGLVVGMVGRLAPWKGQDVFLRAFAAARPDGVDRAVLLGSAMFGESAFEVELRRLVDELGLRSRVELRGFVPDVEAALGEFDVLVHASVTPEPFGQVLVEGMAAGLPVLASGAGGAAEIIHDGVDGLLHAPGDVTALAKQLDQVLSSADLRARLGAAGRERAADFAPDRIGPQVMAAYQRVLAGRRTSKRALPATQAVLTAT